MQPGNLVRITRASIGIPLGSVALIIEKRPARGPRDSYDIYTVKLVGCMAKNRRYLARDLKIVSGRG